MKIEIKPNSKITIENNIITIDEKNSIVKRKLGCLGY